MAHYEDFFSNFEHEINYVPLHLQHDFLSIFDDELDSSSLNLQHDFLFNSDHELDSTKPSNIPPHVKQFEMMNELFVLLKEERNARIELEAKLEKIIEYVVEKNSEQNEHISAESIKQILQDHRQECKDDMKKSSRKLTINLPFSSITLKGNQIKHQLILCILQMQGQIH
jgi:hypothetical protein